eukprot:GFYU01004826.1.p1 GENE.GFYU01004826.1~~GFYU01004826.1.p1  ORF type:complete len:500 (-),score=69.19 GFYU01004826.1:26-1525(-)
MGQLASKARGRMQSKHDAVPWSVEYQWKQFDRLTGPLAPWFEVSSGLQLHEDNRGKLAPNAFTERSLLKESLVSDSVATTSHSTADHTATDTVAARYDALLSTRMQACDDIRESRAVGCLFGNVVGDALGAPLEFRPVRSYEAYTSGEKLSYPVSDGFTNDWLWESSRFKLKPGQWTDDASMALCVTDQLLFHDVHKEADDDYWRELRLRFLHWHEYGYNTPLRGEYRMAFGLGGTVGASFQEFLKLKTVFTTSGDKSASGNGSVIRNGAIPARYHHDVHRAMAMADAQSRTTHQGDEAAECARLLTYFCVRAINSTHSRFTSSTTTTASTSGHGTTNDETRKADQSSTTSAHDDGIESLFDFTGFTTEVAAVRVLCEGVGEDAKVNGWNWRNADWRFHQTRSLSQPTYVGSYAMDCMAAALHCTYHTESFETAVLRAVNYGGDADSVGAVVGQCAGAVYGLGGVPEDWRERVETFDGGETIAKGRLLYSHQQLTLPEA